MGKRYTRITYKDNPKFLRANTKRHTTYKRKCMNGIKLQNFKFKRYMFMHVFTASHSKNGGW